MVPITVVCVLFFALLAFDSLVSYIIHTMDRAEDQEGIND